MVISHDFWTSQFNRDPQILGRTVRVNGEAFTVIGVAPEGFKGIESPSDVQVWLPGSTQATVQHIPLKFRPQGHGFGWYYQFVARLAPGATFDQAQAQLRAAVARVAAAYPEENAELDQAEPRVFPGLGTFPLARGSVRDMLRLLVGVGALLVLLACANVANLSLFRAVQRRGETAVRRALGAGVIRVARLYLTESVTVAVLGGAIGVLLAVWLAQLFQGAIVSGLGKIPGFLLDWRVLALTAGTSVGAGLLFGAAPAVFARRIDVAVALKDAARTGTVARRWLRSGLSVLQLTLCLTLLITSFLFIGTLRNLYRVDLGFDPSRVTMLQIDLTTHGYTDDRARAYYDELLRRVRALPAVSAASVSQVSPLTGMSQRTSVLRPNEDPKDARNVVINSVSSGYFEALGMTPVRGRWFTEGETLRNAPRGERPMVISRTLARELFGDRDPVGQLVSFPATPWRPRRDHVVVGVVGDVRWTDPAEDAPAMVYQPLSSPEGFGVGRAVLLVRSRLAPRDLVPALRDIATSLDDAVPLSEEQSLTAMLQARLGEQWLFAKVLGLLAALAVVLAGAGVYGLVSQTVAERTREFGVRVAVGAERRDILALVMRRAVLLAVLGVVGGLAGAVAIGRVIRSRLYGVAPLDPLIYLLALAALVAIALVASYVPARRASRVDPVAALRYE